LTDAPEAPFWAVLDQLGLPFRVPRQDLIARYGTRPSLWLKGREECHLPAAPLLPGLSEFHFEFSTGPGSVDDLTTAPDRLTATYRAHSHLMPADHRAERNHADVLQILVGLFGPGVEGIASNTLERSWQFGRARLVARSFPRHLNLQFGPNARHLADPGSETETSVTLHPGWLPELTAEQSRWLAAFRPVGTPDPQPVSLGNSPPLWHRWPDELGPRPAPAYGPSVDGAGFVVISDSGYVKTLPRAWLTSVRRDEATRARGPGGTSLSVEFLRSGQPALAPDRVTLAVRPPTSGILRPEAQALAAALSLPLVEHSFPDD